MSRRVDGASILSVGAYRPNRVISNEAVCQRVDSSDDWIRARTGIVTRRWADESESLVAMAATAAAEALEQAAVTRPEVDVVLVATTTAPQAAWPVAQQVQHALGTRGAGLDINASCAGFCHGLGLARELVRGGTVRNVLLIGAERFTDILDPTCRDTAFLFADGCGAVVVGRTEEDTISPVVWGSQPDKAIEMSPTWPEYRNDPTLPRPAIRMQGQRVYRWAAEGMPKVVREALDAAGLRMEELDAFIPHQANARIIKAIVRASRLPEHVRVAWDVVESGNTAAASVPLAMHRILTEEPSRSGDRALLLGFGGGLSYAAQVVTLP